MMMMMNCIDLGGVKGLLGWYYVVPRRGYGTLPW